MPSHTTIRPQPDEHAPFYGGYVALVPDGDVIEILERQADAMQALLASVPEERGGHRYAPGKWSIREVVGHLADTERIMACRALRIARGDPTPLPGFDENAYVEQGGFDTRSLEGLGLELRAARRHTVELFRHLPARAWARRGVANGVPVSVRALAHIIAGHEMHHRALLQERYLAEEGEGA
jgi:hypothetical protein